MSAPPVRTELADTYPAPNNATFRTGIGKLYDYVTGLLGATGNAAEARAALGVVPSYSAIAGFTLSAIAGTSTTASLTVAVGQATALLGSATTQTTQVTKATTTAWAVSNGNAINGYAGGTTLPNSSTIHMFMCSGASGTGAFASTSLTPTFPTGYAVSARRIGSFNTTAAGAPIPGTEIEMGGGSVLRWHATQTLDIAASTLSTTAAVLYSLNVPTGIRVQPLIRLGRTDANATSLILTSGDETDVAPAAYNSAGWTTVPGYDLGGANNPGQASQPELFITTNTSGQIRARATAASVIFSVVTRGYIDFRRN